MIIREKKILIEDIGITFFASNSSKSMRISIHPNKGVRVSVPLFVSFNSAKSFAKSKLKWIKKHVSKIEKLKSEITIFKPGVVFETRFYNIQFKLSSIEKIKLIQRDNIFEILIPDHFDVESSDTQLIIRKEIEKKLRKEAKNYLPNRVEYFAKKHQFNYNKVTIKNSKTRWGSCSATNNINLNLHLMRLPDKLIDYVVLHELVHTKIKNHQKEFWDLLDVVSGDAKVLDKQLKKHHIHIY